MFRNGIVNINIDFLIIKITFKNTVFVQLRIVSNIIAEYSNKYL